MKTKTRKIAAAVVAFAGTAALAASDSAQILAASRPRGF